MILHYVGFVPKTDSPPNSPRWKHDCALRKAPMKTGRLSGMKESYVEGLAPHDGLESCGGSGNAAAEALTEVRASLVLSPEIEFRLGCLSSRSAGRPHQASRFGERRLDPAGSETQCVHGNNLHGNRETRRLASHDGAEVRTVNSKETRR